MTIAEDLASEATTNAADEGTPQERSQGCFWIDGKHVDPQDVVVQTLDEDGEQALAVAELAYHEWLWHGRFMGAGVRAPVMSGYRDGYRDARSTLAAELRNAQAEVNSLRAQIAAIEALHSKTQRPKLAGCTCGEIICPTLAALQHSGPATGEPDAQEPENPTHLALAEAS